jgi:hypothetical protein
MKRMAKFVWVFCGIVTAILAVDAWRLWFERNDLVRYWRAELRKRIGGGRHDPVNMLPRHVDG